MRLTSKSAPAWDSLSFSLHDFVHCGWLFEPSPLVAFITKILGNEIFPSIFTFKGK